MHASELRALQAPFKERYRSDPAAGQVTLRAVGHVRFADLTVHLEVSGPRDGRTGLHPLTGGDGTVACAAEMLLEALIGCAGVTLAAVATSLELPIRAARLQAFGSLDFRGTLGVSKETPVGFQEIRLTFELDSEADDERLAKAVQLAERYCVVAQSLKNVTVDWKRIS